MGGELLRFYLLMKLNVNSKWEQKKRTKTLNWFLKGIYIHSILKKKKKEKRKVVSISSPSRNEMISARREPRPNCFIQKKRRPSVESNNTN